jgi:GTP-binding protein HflX
VRVTDTVGFVRKLPHQLVDAFRSTLEEVAEADLLLHVVDSSAPDPGAQMEAVRTVLADIGAAEVPELLVLNKADLAADQAKRLAAVHPASVTVSAETGEGVDSLLTAVGQRLRALARVVELVVPYDRGDVVAALHRGGEVLAEEHEAAGTRIWARLEPADVGRFEQFRAGSGPRGADRNGETAEG